MYIHTTKPTDTLYEYSNKREIQGSKTVQDFFPRDDKAKKKKSHLLQRLSVSAWPGQQGKSADYCAAPATATDASVTPKSNPTQLCPCTSHLLSY